MKFLRLLLDLFKKKPKPIETPKSDPIPTTPATPVEVKLKKKYVVIVGHSFTDSGAIGVRRASLSNDEYHFTAIEKFKEFDYNLQVAKILKWELGIDYITRDNTGIVGAGLKVVAKKPDVCIELHLNSFKEDSKGCEVLVLEDDEYSSIFGKFLAANFCKKFSRKLRGEEGIKWIGAKDRGYTSLKVLQPIKTAILFEPFFCSNKDEYIEIEDYTNFLIETIKEYDNLY